jgi:hypothetical protein
MYKCSKCKKSLEACDAYEYRGAIACDDCFDDVIEARDFQRNEIIAEESAKTEIFKHLSIDPKCPIGRANIELLRPRIEIASKESGRLKAYEGRNT